MCGVAPPPCPQAFSSWLMFQSLMTTSPLRLLGYLLNVVQKRYSLFANKFCKSKVSKLADVLCHEIADKGPNFSSSLSYGEKCADWRIPDWNTREICGLTTKHCIFTICGLGAPKKFAHGMSPILCGFFKKRERKT